MKSFKLLKQIKPFLYEIMPSPENSSMLVPARIYANADLLKNISNDKTLQQLINVASLPGIVKYAICMPDAHQGYGFPIGGVAASKWPDGFISPGGIGYDINCGVRLLVSNNIYKKDITEKIQTRIVSEILKKIPTGTGKTGSYKLNLNELKKVLEKGAFWAKEKGICNNEDVECIESNGCIKDADSSAVTKEAKIRGIDQLGSVGNGNHFIEIGYVTQIYNEKIALEMGLSENKITVMIHTGSRGLGHQTATDYIKQMQQNLYKYTKNFALPDKQLSFAPLSSEDGKLYFKAMCAAANYAFTNRVCITNGVRESWRKIFGNNSELKLLYDVAHNIAKIETHKVGSENIKLIVHRKGATRALAPKHPDLPNIYKEIGQPVLIPGSMGSSSYVCVGTHKSMSEAWGSCCHGAGRVMSREKAKKLFKGSKIKEELKNNGTFIGTKNLKDLGEEAPGAYKNIESVIDVVTKSGIAEKIAQIKPLCVVK